jgi:hypothetical protein
MVHHPPPRMRASVCITARASPHGVTSRRRTLATQPMATAGSWGIHSTWRLAGVDRRIELWVGNVGGAAETPKSLGKGIATVAAESVDRRKVRNPARAADQQARGEPLAITATPPIHPKISEGRGCEYPPQEVPSLLAHAYTQSMSLVAAHRKHSCVAFAPLGCDSGSGYPTQDAARIAVRCCVLALASRAGEHVSRVIFRLGEDSAELLAWAAACAEEAAAGTLLTPEKVEPEKPKGWRFAEASRAQEQRAKEARAARRRDQQLAAQDDEPAARCLPSPLPQSPSSSRACEVASEGQAGVEPPGHTATEQNSEEGDTELVGGWGPDPAVEAHELEEDLAEFISCASLVAILDPSSMACAAVLGPNANSKPGDDGCHDTPGR